ncbi:hypothetical protein [Psychromicrobium lacuslunae]|uniref:Uncharacterized protein n=1 Tax=Psychromicrobium lacuslunae TaxID=1618207 RepID=A0A0D4C158_9MICC|nr:hypothetical protein [Psychromicrobium lacuslunae]AJT42427.1 hypothetical protein UM93_14650 [Psychromicrobium lacuslunae]
MDGLVSTTLGGLFAQLGVFGFIIVVIGACAIWYLRTSKDLRGEKTGIIASKDSRISELEAANRELYEALMDCRYPNRNPKPPKEGVIDD